MVQDRQDPKNSSSFLITVYAAGWSQPWRYPENWKCLDRINFAFAIPTPDGHLRPLDGKGSDPAVSEDYARDLIAQAHAHEVKVLISVGGWSYHQIPLEATFAEATENDGKINSLVRDIVTMAEDYGFDGVDIDWEYPRRATAAANEKLLTLLGRKLKERGKLLTCAVYAGASAKENGCDNLGNPVTDILDGFTPAAIEAVDNVNIMAYDGGDKELHAGYEWTVRGVEAWKSKCPAGKLVLGVPFYRRPGGSYRKLLEAEPKAKLCDTCLVDSSMAYYNGPDTIARKTRFAMEQGLGGMMAWEMSEDAPGEDSLLYRMAKTCGII